MQLNFKTSPQLAALACIYAEAGKKEEARKILDELTALSHKQYISSYSLAVVHLALGEKEEALRLLEKCFNEREILLQGSFGSIKTDARLNALRNDPRFQKLVERFDSGNL
ncbi:MAG: hypothetical protein QOG67_3033, partial [Verrucomicrobiota bacterium]